MTFNPDDIGAVTHRLTHMVGYALTR